MMTGVLALSIFGAAVWLSVGQYARTETAQGILVTAAGSSKVFASRPGIVSSLLVKDGEVVKAGQKLALIESEQPSATGARYTADGIDALAVQEQLANQQIGLAGERARSEQARLAATMSGLDTQRSSVGRQLELQTEIVKSTKQTFEQIATLVDKGFVSKFEYERRRQAYVVAQQEQSRLTQQLGSVSADYARAQADIGRTRINSQAEANEVRSSVQALRQQKSRLESEGRYSVEAPIAGRVTAIQTGTGRTVGGTMPLLSIVPTGSALKAEIYAPSRAVGFLKRGQEVRLLYDAFPYQRFGSFTGRIDSVSRVVMSPTEIDAPLRIEEPVYRVSTSIDAQSLTAFGEKVALQPGMTLTANIVLDRRSFWDWLMTPFNAIANRT